MRLCGWNASVISESGTTLRTKLLNLFAVVSAKARELCSTKAASQVDDWRLLSASLGRHVSHVVQVRADEQMGRVDAPWRVALVADEHTARNRTPVRQFPRYGVSLSDAAVGADAPIAQSVVATIPQPALVRPSLFHSSPESGLQVAVPNSPAAYRRAGLVREGRFPHRYLAAISTDRLNPHAAARLFDLASYGPAACDRAGDVWFLPEFAALPHHNAPASRASRGYARYVQHHLVSICASMMRRTSSAIEIPSRLASRFKNALCGSVNEIICLTTIRSTDELSAFNSEHKQRDNSVVFGFSQPPFRVHRGDLVGVNDHQTSEPVMVGAHSFGRSLWKHCLHCFCRHLERIPQGIRHEAFV